MHQFDESVFESIESAHEYVRLLSQVVKAAKEDLNGDVERERKGAKLTRRLHAVQLAAYSLDKLDKHVATSSRILNDLRSLRRLLFEERGAKVLAA